jgi:hypothetical protein
MAYRTECEGCQKPAALTIRCEGCGRAQCGSCSPSGTCSQCLIVRRSVLRPVVAAPRFHPVVRFRINVLIFVSVAVILAGFTIGPKVNGTICHRPGPPLKTTIAPALLGALQDDFASMNGFIRAAEPGSVRALIGLQAGDEIGPVTTTVRRDTAIEFTAQVTRGPMRHDLLVTVPLRP